jgi:hypothetical protein
MSAASRKARKEAREFDVTPIVDAEPTAKLFGIYQEPNQGYRTVCVELPASLLEQYAVKVSEPEMLQLALAHLFREIERHALGAK